MGTVYDLVGDRVAGETDWVLHEYGRYLRRPNNKDLIGDFKERLRFELENVIGVEPRIASRLTTSYVFGANSGSLWGFFEDTIEEELELRFPHMYERLGFFVDISPNKSRVSADITINPTSGTLQHYIDKVVGSEGAEGFADDLVDFLGDVDVMLFHHLRDDLSAVLDIMQKDIDKALSRRRS